MRAPRAPLAAVLAALALASPAGAERARAGEPPRAAAGPLAGLFGGPFALTDHHGRPVTERSFAGKHMLVYFGYTNCPDICPADLTAIAAALDDIGALADRLHALFVTVDPARDDAAALRAFAGAIHPALLGLTGTEAQVAAAARAWRVHRRRFRVEGMAEGAYFVDHSPNAYLMGPDGGFVTLLPHGTPPERIAAVLRRRLSDGR